MKPVKTFQGFLKITLSPNAKSKDEVRIKSQIKNLVVQQPRKYVSNWASMLAISKIKPMITKTFFAMIVVLDDSRTFLISPNSPIKNTRPEMIVANWNVSIKVAANVQGLAKAVYFFELPAEPHNKYIFI